MNPAIEQAVKALERAKYALKARELTDYIDYAINDLRALTEPSKTEISPQASHASDAKTEAMNQHGEPVDAQERGVICKTDEELARELAEAVLARYVSTMPYEETIKDCAEPITQAFTAIRAQVLDDVTMRLKANQFSPAPYTDMMETLRKLKATK